MPNPCRRQWRQLARTVEEVRVGLGGLAVHLKDVHEVVELSVRVAAYGHVTALTRIILGRDGDGEQRGQRGQDVSELQQQSQRILLVDALLRLEPLHHGTHEIHRHHLANVRAVVGLIHHCRFACVRVRAS